MDARGLICLLLEFSLATIVSAQTGICKINLMMVVDRSGSIVIDQKPRPKPENWILVRKFLVDVCMDLDSSISTLGLVTFGNTGRLELPLGNHPESVLKPIFSNLPYDSQYGENTNTTGGLFIANEQFTEEHLNDDSARNIILILTDGKASADIMRPGWNEMLFGVNQRIKDRRIHIIGVGVTENVDVAEIRRLVTDPDKDYVPVTDFSALEPSLATQIICPPDCSRCCPKRCGNPMPSCYYPPVCPSACDRVCPDPNYPVLLDNGQCGIESDCDNQCSEHCNIDLMIVLDESGSISKDAIAKGFPDYWLRDVQPFLRSIIESLDIGLHATQVGLIMYNDNSRIVFGLNEILDKQQMLARIDQIFCRCVDGGKTNTASGLRLARQHLSQSTSGNRPGAKDVVIVITDGMYNVEVANVFPEAELLKREAKLVAVGVSQEVDRTQIESILDNPSQDYIPVDRFDQLKDVLSKVMEMACNKCPPPNVCPAPVPIDAVYAFSAHSSGMLVFSGRIVIFQETYLNIGLGYNANNGVFKCPCKGLYIFIHECNGLDFNYSAVITSGKPISPEAIVTGSGSASTSAIYVCDEDERISVQINSQYYQRANHLNMLNGLSCGFKGTLLHALK